MRSSAQKLPTRAVPSLWHVFAGSPGSQQSTRPGPGGSTRCRWLSFLPRPAGLGVSHAEAEAHLKRRAEYHVEAVGPPPMARAQCSVRAPDLPGQRSHRDPHGVHFFQLISDTFFPAISLAHPEVLQSDLRPSMKFPDIVLNLTQCTAQLPVQSEARHKNPHLNRTQSGLHVFCLGELTPGRTLFVFVFAFV